MNEKSLPVLEQYDYKIKNVKRVRGSYYCDTDKGLMLLKEYENSRGKLEVVEKIQNFLEDNGVKTDRVVRNKSGDLYSIGPDGGYYILKKWYEHRESQPESDSDNLKNIEALARFHSIVDGAKYLFEDNGRDGNLILKSSLVACEKDEEESEPQVRECRIPVADGIKETLQRHNKEMIRVSRFLAKKKRKTDFEFSLVNNINYYLEQAVREEESISSEDSRALRDKARSDVSVCHGNSRYHNFIMVNEEPVLVNFVKVCINSQMMDVYTFMKKTMEKNEWNIALAENLMNRYESIKPMSETEKKALFVLLRYPDRFWKVANNYYNSNKSGYSEKNREKMEKINAEKEKRNKFISYFS